MIKGVTHAHLGPIWYHSEPSDVPYSQNQFLDGDFFATSYSKAALDYYLFMNFGQNLRNLTLGTWQED